MSHSLVAAVWEQLGRRDLANILREIIGEHAADLAVVQIQDGDATKIEQLIRSVFWMKVIFDLQRTYVQRLRTTRDVFTGFSPYLLPSESIFSTLMYLVQVKSKLFPSNTKVPINLLCYRQFLAHTLLAGVRLLLLRGEDIPTDSKFNLERVMISAWQHPDLTGAESFLISDLLPRAVYSTGSVDLSKNRISFSSFVPGPHQHPGSPETLMTDLLTALIKNKADTLTPFCCLFDTLWTAESTLVQCHIDCRRLSQEQSSTGSKASGLEITLKQTTETRKKLVRTVLAAFDDEFNNPSLQVLATVILSQNADGQPPLQTRRIRDTWTKLSRMREVWEGALGQFVRWLINRRVQMWDSNGELEASSRDYQAHLTQWLKASPIDSNQSENRLSATYTMDCPAGHAVSRSLLEDRLRKCDPVAYEQLQDDPESFTFDMSCPLCPGNIRTQRAQKIELFDRPSSSPNVGSQADNRRHSLPESLSRNTTSASSSLSHSTSQSSARFDGSDVLKSPITPTSHTSGHYETSTNPHNSSSPEFLSPLYMRNSTEQPPDKQMARSLSRDLKSVKLPFSNSGSLFRKSSSKHRQLPQQFRFCFSASGTKLLCWSPGSNWIMRFETFHDERQKHKPHRYDVSGLQYVAAGDQACAVIASVGEHHELLVFRNAAKHPDAHIAIETPLRKLPPICMVMSRDDKYIAFTLEDEVRVYDISTKIIKRVPLGTPLPPDPTFVMTSSGQTPGVEIPEEKQAPLIDRKLQFSVDGKHFIVATHLGDQCAYVDVWDRQAEGWPTAPDSSRSFQLPQWTSSDEDLTSVFYDSLSRAVLLTGFFGKEYPMLLSMSDSNTITSDPQPLSVKIAHAAQSMTESRFVIANGLGQIILYDSRADGGNHSSSTLKRAISKISLSAFRPGQLALSFPRDNEVHIFWLKNGKMLLRKVQLHEGSEVVNEYDLRTDFDRLMAERPSSGEFNTMPRRTHSLLSNAPIGENKTYAAIPERPDLPELPSS